jgi:hypothetical protein
MKMPGWTSIELRGRAAQAQRHALLVAMKIKLITTILLVLCGLGIGWLAFENLMWAIWGKQNRWFEYVGFWGCPIMFVSGLIALKSLRVGSVLGSLGFVLMLFYLGPAIVNTLYRMIVGHLELSAPQILELVFIIGIPAITLVQLIWNVTHTSSATRP